MHHRLDKQLRRYLGTSDVPEALRDFVDAVNRCYISADAELKFTGHTLNVMSDELTERNAILQRERDEQAALARRLEEAHHQLLQSEKMASIGQLAAGVAHEINNPIGYVSSNLKSLGDAVADLLTVVEACQRAAPQLPEGERAAFAAACREVDLDFLRDDITAMLAESREGIDRVRRIVKDLKDFSHVGESEMAWVDLHHGLESTLNIVANEVKYRADVVRDYGELPDVLCQASQINQVFMNLLVNAAQAMPAGRRGTIRVRTRSEGDAQVRVDIADDGSGISAEHLARIFDPFFTTKPVGQGTGLGLSLSYSIVQKHNGRIAVDSQPGVGTTFSIYLPVAQPVAQPAA